MGPRPPIDLTRYGLYKYVQAARLEVPRGSGYWARKASAAERARAEWTAARDAWERQQSEVRLARQRAQAVRHTADYQRRKRRAGQLAPEIDSLGLPLPERFACDVSALQARLRELIGLGRRAVAAAEARADVLPRAGLHRLLAGAAQLRSDAAALMPASVCPYCRLLPALQGDCRGCHGRGYLTAAELCDVPSALLRTDHPLVRGPNGDAMPYEQALHLDTGD